MKKFVLLVVCATLSFSLLLLPAAARSPAMTYCSGQWAKMKDAGKTQGQTWPQFWSHCSEDYAAPRAKSAAVTEVRACRPSLSNLWKCPDTIKSGQNAQKKECDRRWRDYKTRTGAHGWHDYFAFMAKCM